MKKTAEAFPPFTTLLRYFEFTRPFTLLAPPLGVLSGAIVAYGAFPHFSVDYSLNGIELAIALVFASLSSALLNAASNGLNQICDIEVDRINKPTRHLPAGKMSSQEAAILTTLLYICSWLLAFFVNLAFFILVLIASLCTILYSAPPFRLKRHWLSSNLTIAISRGALLKVAGWSVVKSVVNAEAWFMGTIFGLFLLGATSTKDFSDMEGDYEDGCKTLPIRFGPRKAIWLIAPFFIFPFLLLILGVFFKILTGNPWLIVLLSILLMLWGIVVFRLMLADPDRLSIDDNHPSWKHMYLMMMTAQIGLAVAYCPGILNPVIPTPVIPSEARDLNTVPRIVVLGFDGVDPDLCSQWIAEGKLPNLKSLKEKGAFLPLESSNPPESPVAWASFETGSNPGKHRIYDFLYRDPKTYFPEIAYVENSPPKFLWKKIPIRKPTLTNRRGGVAFWDVLEKAESSQLLLRLPLTFPPPHLRHGKLLSGLGVPDLRGTNGTFFYWETSDDLREKEYSTMGGVMGGIHLDAFGKAKLHIEGPEDFANGADMRLSVEFEIQWDDHEGSLILAGPAGTIKIGEGEWSGWIPLIFSIPPFVKLRGMTRFYLLSAPPKLKVYMMPIQFDPRSPPFSISSPKGYSQELVEHYGLFKTLGWQEETWALNEEKISEEVFLEDLFREMEMNRKMTLGELKKNKIPLFVSVFTETDRVSHLFWRFLDQSHPLYSKAGAKKYGDSILKVYQAMDQIIGDVLKEIDSKTILFVVSDHGFKSFRKGFNINTWLYKNGYLTFKKDSNSSQRKLDDLFFKTSFFEYVDWSRTKAYALGLGQIYLNLKGREAYGIVENGEEEQRLKDTIRKKLLEFRDVDNGIFPVREVYKREDIYHGEFFSEAPDLQIGFRDGYRVSWQTALGATPRDILEINRKKWSGDHCSFDYREVPGVLFSNKRLREKKISIIDLAPTFLSLLGTKKEPNMDGRVFQLNE